MVRRGWMWREALGAGGGGRRWGLGVVVRLGAEGCTGLGVEGSSQAAAQTSKSRCRCGWVCWLGVLVGCVGAVG